MPATAIEPEAVGPEFWGHVYTEIEAVKQLALLTANIVGPAYGARMCDRALRVRDLIWHLQSGVDRVAWNRDRVAVSGDGDTLLIAADKLRPANARATLGDEAHWKHVLDSLSRRRWPALSAIEHQRLGLRLKEAQERLDRVHDCLCRRLGKHHDVAQRAPKAARAVARLANCLAALDDRGTQ